MSIRSQSRNQQLISVHDDLDEEECCQIRQSWSSLERRQEAIPMTRSTSDDVLVKCLKAEITSRVFRIFPSRVLRLPGMKLMKKSDVVDFINLNKLKDLVEDLVRKTRDKQGGPSGDDIAASVKRVTEFAILSHMWGQDEPSHTDFLKDLNVTTSPKYEKLRRFCCVAYQQHRADFAWADTVCIDKLSSSELDESIRSMFSWYHESSICIIYLAGTDTLSSFPFDKWFTRGWTLQELLSPLRIKFYNKNWQPLTNLYDDKLDQTCATTVRDVLQSKLLSDGISMAAGVPIDRIRVFQPGLRDPPFPERMKWIARRETTRPEDMAYSMMGVLGVSIPVAYGEGAERAFYRLFRAVLEVDWSPSWFLWGGKAISLNIHPSRMIPSSPRCYLSWNLGCDPFENMPRPPRWDRRNMGKRESVALTNTGLPIELLVVPAKVIPVVHSPDADSSAHHDAEITCPISNDTIKMAVQPRDGPANLKEQFALGILDYDFAPKCIPNTYDSQNGPQSVPRSTQRSPQQRQRVYAILLHRYHGPGEDKEWQCSEWERVETGEIIRFDIKSRFCRMKVDGRTRVEILGSEVSGEDEDIVSNQGVEFWSLHL